MSTLIGGLGGPALLIFFGSFLAMIGALWSASQQQAKDKEIAKLSQTTVQSIIGGDSYCYLVSSDGKDPYYSVLSSGNFPLYDISMQMWETADLDALFAQQQNVSLETMHSHIKAISVGNLSANSSLLLGRGIFNLTSDRKLFRVQYTARNGTFYQYLLMRKTADAEWHSAIRVFRSINNGPSELVRTEISKGFPRESDGSILWK